MKKFDPRSAMSKSRDLAHKTTAFGKQKYADHKANKVVSHGYYDDKVSGPKLKSEKSGFGKGRSRKDTWGQLQSMTTADRRATQDVHNTQILERGVIEEVSSKTWPNVGSALAGVGAFLLVWFVWGVLGFFTMSMGLNTLGMNNDPASSVSAEELGVPPYYEKSMMDYGTSGVSIECYQLLDPQGKPIGECSRDKVAEPDWHKQMVTDRLIEEGYISPEEAVEADKENDNSLSGWLLFAHAGWGRFFVSVAVGLGTGAATRTALMRVWQAQNLSRDNTDINQHTDDQHIQVVEEIVNNYQVFPNVGAHSPVQVSSMISHLHLSNKGVKTVKVARRADKDILNKHGEVETYKGEILYDEHGNEIVDELPMFDTTFGHKLYEASGVPEVKELRRFFDPSKMPSNPGGKIFDKFGNAATVAEHINKYWEYPTYEPQRPSGVYIIDEAPVNTMVLAITRAGKGQTYIEPVIDMWLREINYNNMVINDPKGELLVKHYVRATVRGFKVVQFNLINPLKTDIYNPMALAAGAAREGDAKACATYVENIAEVFFPVDGADDPVWPNAANNAFKRTAYGLIDFYLEEEREMRKKAAQEGWAIKTLDTRLDQMWGRVTLYNCYQFFVQLSAKKQKNPLQELAKKAEEEQYTATQQELDDATELSTLWNGEPEVDQLTLFFNATDRLPVNSMRNLVGNADKALRAMGGAEKMLASVYGIAITAMSFFTDPTIARLTSGTLSQNTDLGGLSFPRRFGVRFNQDYIAKYKLIGTQAVWESFEDARFTKPLGKDFQHSDIVSSDGWAMYYFKGIFPNNVSYMKLSLFNNSGMLIKELFFRFTKSYKTSLSGLQRVKDPVLGDNIVLNGTMEELLCTRDINGNVVYKPGHVTFSDRKLSINFMTDKQLLSMDTDKVQPINVETPAVLQTSVNYSEKPSAVFLVTPPHLMKYAKIILILITQLVSLNFDKSYMTKSNQKPLYKTRYMLDELGNLQSEGNGISGLETYLSIGLGQEQQFTLILQTLQQLKDVYGDSVDKIVQGNANPLHTLIATPTGWQTMGDTHVGDVILTPFGDRTTVTGVFPKGTRPVYRVTLRDGSTSESCEQHLWQIESEQISEVIDTLELKRRIDAGKQVDLPRLEPLDYNKRDYSLDPYVLGVILACGSIQSNGDVKFGTNDIGIVEEIRRRGYNVVEATERSKRRIIYWINDVKNTIRMLGLEDKHSWETFIPESYLYGSVEQRLDLLRGLMDADGSINSNGRMSFSCESKRLAENVQALIRSLGGRAIFNVWTNVTFVSFDQLWLPKLNPFLLPRKAERWVERDDNSGNRVVSVEYVRDEPVQCISVADPRHLYVIDDYMPTHNTSNIVFLKSTDDTMIETLSKMSGTTHVAYRNSKSVTQDVKDILTPTESKVTYTMAVEEEPVISYNDLAYLPPRNSIVFRAGDPPIWNRNQTILPMSFKLFSNTITHPGHDYTLQTVPTLSSAAEFDVRKNQPDFTTMLAKRIKQASKAEIADRIFRESYGYNDYAVSLLDPDVYANEVMDLINVTLHKDDLIAEAKDKAQRKDTGDSDSGVEAGSATRKLSEDLNNSATDNQEVKAETQRMGAHQQDAEKKRYAGGTISRDDLRNIDLITGEAGSARTGWLQEQIIEAYMEAIHYFEKDPQFEVDKRNQLSSHVSNTMFIKCKDDLVDIHTVQQAATESDKRVYDDGDDIDENDLTYSSQYEVTPAFYNFLCEREQWDFAEGRFEQEMARIMKEG